MAGKSQFFDSEEYKYPIPLIEVNSKTIIEHSINNLLQIANIQSFTFVLNEADCFSYHLDNIISLLIKDYNYSIFKVKNETKGALASSFFAIDKLNNNEELIICNYDQIINYDINQIINYFKTNKADAGVLTFESIHPRWSFVKCNTSDKVIEISEKDPISKKAIAGFYYFSSGNMFYNSAMKVFYNKTHINEKYYISSVFNELILDNKNILHYFIDKLNFHTFYSPLKIKEYESKGK